MMQRVCMKKRINKNEMLMKPAIDKKPKPS